MVSLIWGRRRLDVSIFCSPSFAFLVGFEGVEADLMWLSFSGSDEEMNEWTSGPCQPRGVLRKGTIRVTEWQYHFAKGAARYCSSLGFLRCLVNYRSGDCAVILRYERDVQIWQLWEYGSSYFLIYISQ